MRIERQLHHINARPIAVASEQFADCAATANPDLSFDSLTFPQTVLLCFGLRRIAATLGDTANECAVLIDSYLLKSLFNMGLRRLFEEIDFYKIDLLAPAKWFIRPKAVMRFALQERHGANVLGTWFSPFGVVEIVSRLRKFGLRFAL